MYFPSGFTILVGLFLKPLGLGAEFNSVSNPTSFERDPNGKVAKILEILSLRQISRYFLSGFAIQLGLFLKQLGLGAEFNSASNATGFECDPNGKNAEILEILSFGTGFDVFPVRIRNTTWVIPKRTWVRCRN
jgi:hypothetical protein